MRSTLLMAAPVVAVALVGCATNSAPVTPSVAIGPEGADTTQDLVLLLDGEGADEDGDVVSYGIQWSVDGELRSDLEGARSVPFARTAKGQVWTVQVTSTDGMERGEEKSAELTIANAAPVAEITEVPFAPDADEDFTIGADGSDPDGDAITLRYSWTVDGVDAGIDGPVVAASRTERGQVWEVSVIADDAEAQSEPVTAVVDIANRRPTVQAVSVTPSRATEASTLTASGIGFDQDGDPVTLTWAWYVNGAEVKRGESNTLDGASFDKGDAVVAVAIANDGFVDGEPVAADPIEILNTAPSVGVATIDQTDVSEDVSVTCSTDGLEDLDGDPVEVRISWEVDGRPVLDGESLDGSRFDKGDQIVCVATPFDGTDEGRAVRSAPVRVQNATPTIGAVAIDQASPREGDVLTVSLTDVVDLDDDAVELRYSWSIDGVVVGTGPTLSSESFEKGDVITVTVTPFDGEVEGAPVASATVTVLNSVPVVDSVSLSPSEVRTDDAITAVVTTSDADGDEVSLTYTWYVGGAVVSGETGATLPASAFSKDEEVSVSVLPNDGEEDGVEQDSATLTVLNTAPSFTAVSISPTEVTEGTTLTCAGTGWTDADGDEENYDTAWFVNDVEVSDSATLDGSLFDRDDSVYCQLTANDLDDEGNSLTSSTVEVANTAPELDSVSLDSSTPSTGDTLTATAGTTTDADDDTVTVTYAWTIDGEDAGTGASLDLTDVARGAVIVVTATPTDGTDEGTPVTATATVQNAVPVISAVTLSPSTAYVDSTLTAAVTATDADDDALSLTYAWYVDGTLVGGETTSSLSGAFVSGQEVEVVVTADDGTDTSATFTSSAVEISNSVPSIASVALDKSTLREGDTVTCTPSGFSDADGDSPVYTYAWTVNGGTVSGATTASLTGASFDKGDSVVCSVTPGDGSDTGTAVASAAVSVVNTVPVLASLSLPSSIDASADVVPTLGATSDADGDTVSLSYSWLIDGVEVSTDDELDASLFAKGDAISLSVTPNDGEADGAAVTAGPITVANSAPTIESLALSPSAPSSQDDVSVVVTTDDADGDTITLSYAWTVGGTSLSEITDTVDASSFSKGDVLAVTVTADDGTDSVTDTLSVTIGNAAPSIDAVTLSPSTGAVEKSTLTCAIGTFSDPDGDSDASTYAWTVNGTTISATTATLTGSDFGKDDVVTCVVTPFDGVDSGAAVTSNSVTIGNTAPTLASVSLPGTISRASDVTPVLGAATDDDGDSISYSYSWTVDGTEVSTAATLDRSLFEAGDVIGLSVTPTDGTDAGSSVSATAVTATDAAPEITSLSLSPSAPGTGDDLTASVVATDADGDTVSLTYAWTVGGSTVTGATTATLSADEYVKGDVVAVSVTATANSLTDTDSASVTVVNTVPTAPVAAISGSVTEVEDDEAIVCVVDTASTDADGDTISYVISWSVDGSAHTGTTATTTLAGDTIPSSVNKPGETWTCTIEADDGTGKSAEATASVEVEYCTFEIVADDSVNIDYGGSSASTGDLVVWNDTGVDSFGWFNFDVSAIGSTRDVRSATLSVYETGSASGSPSIEVSYSEDDSWVSSTATSSSISADETVSTAGVSTLPADDYTELDIDVDAWPFSDDLVDGQATLGVFTDTAGGLAEFYDQTESGKQPTLTLRLESCD